MIVLSILNVICGCATKRSLPATDYNVVVWDHGKKTEVESVADNEQVVKAVTQIVKNSDDMMQLLVTDKLITKLQKERKCMELTLGSPLTLKVGEEEVSFTRLLIPIASASENGTEAIVFYLGDKKRYFTPPYVSTQGKPDFLSLAKLLDFTSMIDN